MGLKIQVTVDNVHQVAAVLKRFAEHRDGCGECREAIRLRDAGGYCATGAGILLELREWSEVEEVKD